MQTSAGATPGRLNGPSLCTFAHLQQSSPAPRPKRASASRYSAQYKSSASLVSSETACLHHASRQQRFALMLHDRLDMRRIIALACISATLLYFLYSFRSTFSSPWSAPERRARSSNQGDIQNILNETLGFEKIFVISLPSRNDHRDAMSLAAAYTGLKIEYVNGVTSIDNKTLPPGGLERGLNYGSLLAWRAHVNVLRTIHEQMPIIPRIVEQNLSSAFVLEDDIDWDLRIKSQMTNFAKASRLLVQPLPGTKGQYLDPSHPQPSPGQSHQDFTIGEATTSDPTTSPYGDLANGDFLWLGHCGCRFPRLEDKTAPLGRVVIHDDETVPEKQHLDMEYGTDELGREYPAHTRVVSRARVNTCSLAYGISQLGARRMLYELGVHKMTDTADMMFRFACDGVDGRTLRTCLTVQPQLFQHHRPVGPKSSFSDISDHGEGNNDKAFSRNIRWSARLNLPKLVEGETDYIDLFRDGEQKIPLGPGRRS